MDGSFVKTPSELLAARLSRRGLATLTAGTLTTLGLGGEIGAKMRGKRGRPGAQRPQLAFQFVTAWGSQGNGNGEFNAPAGVATDSQDNVYVVDAANDRIQKFTRTGVFLTAWGSFGQANGQFWNPQFVAIDADDVVYVTDAGNARVQKFTSTGDLRDRVGHGGLRQRRLPGSQGHRPG